MKKLSIFIALFAILFGAQAQKNQYVVKGQVVAREGFPIMSATVLNPKDTTDKVICDSNGLFALYSDHKIDQVRAAKFGFSTVTVDVRGQTFVTLTLDPVRVLQDNAVEEVELQQDAVQSEHQPPSPRHFRKNSPTALGPVMVFDQAKIQHNTESYSPIDENIFHSVVDEPLSTFSADVDRASYSNVRRMLNLGDLPPVDAVRVEEMINYFGYDYDSPSGRDPVAIFTETARAPWNDDHYIMHIGIKAKELEKQDLPPSNLVFLIDVSGSMQSPNKLPLLKSAMKMLVGELRDEDRVAIVVYAGAAGLVLESTPGHEKGKINAAIDQLSAGGSTAGGAGIKLAYKVAVDNLMKEGNNRVIIATDGDFNVGASSDGEMQRLIETEREKGVFLTALGFGMGNYKDSKMETLADKGNGNYAYIDNITEAKKTLVSEFGGTLFTIAKDVKLQVEFNPATVDEYRLIGYENRKLNNEDFNDDKKDAGEMGVGHVVTALYEIVPKGKGQTSKIDPLKYQYDPLDDLGQSKGEYGNELATVKVRYKEPEGETSKFISQVVANDVKKMQMASNNVKWSSSVAGFGMLLRKSDHRGNASYESVISLARSAVGDDKEGYRRECIQLMESAMYIDRNTAAR